nr:MAG TPA: hypothetical protein [Caudoviricetes sp.]
MVSAGGFPINKDECSAYRSGCTLFGMNATVKQR